MRKLLCVTVLGMAVVPGIAQENLPAFDVVSVKRNLSNSDRQSMQLMPGGRGVVTNTPALEEQLGLKLRPARRSVAVTVIDRVEPPSEN